MVPDPRSVGAPRGHFRVSLLWMPPGRRQEEPPEERTGQWSLISSQTISLRLSQIALLALLVES